MVCAFGLGPEATAWLASKGGSVLRGFHNHGSGDAAVGLSSVDDGGRSNIARSHGKGRQFLPSTSFGEKEDISHAPPDAGECFPAASSVYVKGKGPVRMDEICPGDNLLTGNAYSGKLAFSPFVGHMHMEVGRYANYICVRFVGHTPEHTLRVSKSHLIFAASMRDSPMMAIRAENLHTGSWVCRVDCDGVLDRVQIAEVSKEVAELGVYGPLTQSGTVVVDGSLCSCYVDAWPTTCPSWLRHIARPMRQHT